MGNLTIEMKVPLDLLIDLLLKLVGLSVFNIKIKWIEMQMRTVISYGVLSPPRTRCSASTVGVLLLPLGCEISHSLGKEDKWQVQDTHEKRRRHTVTVRESLMDYGTIKLETLKFTLIYNQTWKYYVIIVYLMKIHL